MNIQRQRELATCRDLYHDDRVPIAMGCMNCRTIAVCGGLQIRKVLYDCRDLCCGRPADCQAVCSRRGAAYVRDIQEVGGLELVIPTSSNVPEVTLPSRVPMLYSASGRTQPLRTPAVAIPLAALYSRKSGIAKYATRSDLANAYRFAPAAKIIVSGVDVDKAIERYWGPARDAGIVQHLADLKPDLVTVPNYSLFLNVPREDNLHNMKRIAICWHELSCAGLNAAVHLNARTNTDWGQWSVLLREHPEITVIAVEFATGLRNPGRALWHVEQLERLQQLVGRDLQLVIRGERYFGRLKRTFPRITMIDTSLFMKSMHRQKLVVRDGTEPRWARTMTLVDQPLDDLFQANVDIWTRLKAS